MITKNFIKMCEQAEEIQKSNINIGKRHFSNQDFVAYNFGEGLKVYICSEISRYWLMDDLIWLPTQEQLQEMVLPIFLKIFSTTHALQNDPSFIHRMFIAEFEKWINRSSPSKDEYMVMFGSLVELLLAFVMHEKYNKIGTGEKWVKIE